MSFIPKIKVCIEGSCDKINLFEETGIYNPNNLTGWGAPNPITSGIWGSEVRISDYTGNTLLETIILKDQLGIDVYTPVVGSPTPGPFLAVQDYEWTHQDGVYTIVYEVGIGDKEEDQTFFYNKSQKVLFTCNLESCIRSLKSKIIEECSSNQMSKIKTKIDQLEILYYGIKSAFSCDDIITVNNLLENAKIICDNLCDCGCGDC